MALAASLAFLWFDARQQREYRRLLAAGDEAVTRGQTLEAIEAFSGALTLKPDSMIARLMRGETYRQRGEFAAAWLGHRSAAAAGVLLRGGSGRGGQVRRGHIAA